MFMIQHLCIIPPAGTPSSSSRTTRARSSWRCWRRRARRAPRGVCLYSEGLGLGLGLAPASLRNNSFCASLDHGIQQRKLLCEPWPTSLGRGDDALGNPHRAQLSHFELFERILLLKLDKQLLVEQFEATVSQSTVPSPPLLSMNRVSTEVTFGRGDLGVCPLGCFTGAQDYLVSNWRGVPQGSPQGQTLRALLLRGTSVPPWVRTMTLRAVVISAISGAPASAAPPESFLEVGPVVAIVVISYSRLVAWKLGNTVPVITRTATRMFLTPPSCRVICNLHVCIYIYIYIYIYIRTCICVCIYGWVWPESSAWCPVIDRVVVLCVYTTTVTTLILLWSLVAYG